MYDHTCPMVILELFFSLSCFLHLLHTAAVGASRAPLMALSAATMAINHGIVLPYAYRPTMDIRRSVCQLHVLPRLLYTDRTET